LRHLPTGPDSGASGHLEIGEGPSIARPFLIDGSGELRNGRGVDVVKDANEVVTPVDVQSGKLVRVGDRFR
jgi:hypothetical protein